MDELIELRRTPFNCDGGRPSAVGLGSRKENREGTSCLERPLGLILLALLEPSGFVPLGRLLCVGVDDRSLGLILSGILM